MIICAQYVLPITQEALVDGALLVKDGLIADVGPADMLKLRYPDEEVRTFRQAAIIPGLIDLHTHLEYSVFNGMLPDSSYAQWVDSMRNIGVRLDSKDWSASAALGCLEALSNGTTCVADISSTGASGGVMKRLGLRGVVYREVGTADKRRVSDAMAIARKDIEQWQDATDAALVRIGIAPRETYECHPLVYQQAAQMAAELNIPLALSVAESFEEAQFIRYGASIFSVENLGDKRGFVELPPWLPTGVTPLRYVVNWGAFEAPNVLAFHCVHVDDDDIKKLKEYDVAVAVCSRCNAQLSMGAAPVLDFLRYGLRVGLGTGYSASNDSNDLLSEMRIGMLLQRSINPGKIVRADTMLEMATIGAARALRMDDRIGSLEIGKCADIAVVDLEDSRQKVISDVPSALVNACTGSDVLMTMVDGVVRYEKSNLRVDGGIAQDIARVIEIRGRLGR